MSSNRSRGRVRPATKAEQPVDDQQPKPAVKPAAESAPPSRTDRCAVERCPDERWIGDICRRHYLEGVTP